jgi:hypothetical protein
MGMGVKFYSPFSDGTLILSSNFKSSAVPRPSSKITRLPPQRTIEDTWGLHKAKAQNKLRAVHPLAKIMTFEHYATMSALEDDVSQYITR